MIGRPDVLDKEWIDKDRELRIELLKHAGYDAATSEEAYRQVVVTFLIAICNELQYMNDSFDVVNTDHKESNAGFKLGGTDGSED